MVPREPGTGAAVEAPRMDKTATRVVKENILDGVVQCGGGSGSGGVVKVILVELWKKWASGTALYISQVVLLGATREP